MPPAADPRIIDLELTNFCNTVCAFCPRNAITRPFGMMTDRTFRTIVHQLKEHCRPYVVNFSGMGECLLHPKLTFFLTVIKKELGCLTGLTTNGHALTPPLIAALLRAKPDFITVSFSGMDKTLENIKKLVQLRTERSPRVHITLIDGIAAPRTKAYWRRFGIDGVNLQPLHNRGGHLLHAVSKKGTRIKDRECQIFRNSLFITWEGIVLSCCHDLAGAQVLGDMTGRSLRTILKKRNTYISKALPFPLCHTCNDPRRSQYFDHGRFITCRR